MENHIFDLSRDFFIQYKKRDFEWQMPVFHYHNSYELYFLESGTRSVLINDKLFEINQYDVILFKPNIYHRNSGGSNHTRTVVNFTKKFLDLYFTPQTIALMLNCFDKNVISLNKKVFETAKDILVKIQNQDAENKDNYIFAYLFDLLLLLNENKGHPTESIPSNSTKTIVPILSYVSKNYKNISSISQISDHFYITKYHLCRIFKESTGLTITQYINDLKIRHACELLNESNSSITDIGFMCGFNSTMYFCKTFKEIVKMTPSEFRQHRINLHQ